MPHVLMYTTAYCPYCTAAEKLLHAKGVDHIEKVRIDTDPVLREQMMARSGGRRSVPQIFIDDTHVGGFDDLSALNQAGRLDPLLQGTPPEAQP